MIAYGMNTNLDNMHWRCPTARCLGYAILPGYTLKFRQHADIEPDVTRQLVGVLWDISDEDLKELDGLEGYPTYYTRKNVKVLYNNQVLDAFVYIMNDQDYELAPDPGYLDLCINGYESNQVPVNQLEEAYNSALFNYNKIVA